MHRMQNVKSRALDQGASKICRFPAAVIIRLNALCVYGGGGGGGGRTLNDAWRSFQKTQCS